MNDRSVLSRFDYEDYLIRLYFRATDDYLGVCIDRAYLDISRTLHGLGKLASKEELHRQARSTLWHLFTDLRNDTVQSGGQDAFDGWHRAQVENLCALYAAHGYQRMFVGQAQKWLNMAFKYIFTMGERRLPGYGKVYPFCHAPLDNVVIEHLAVYGLPALPCAWSRLNDYDEYLAYQRWIRRRFTLVPLDVGFLLWLDKEENADRLV